MAVDYDSSVLERFAERLYLQAAAAVVKAVFAFGFLGLVGSLVAARFTHDDPVMFALIGTVACGVAGWAIGSQRAFKMRLEAQRTMCQVQIERNTRA